MKSLAHDDARIMRCLTPTIALLSVDHWTEIATSSSFLFRLEDVESNAMASAMILNSSCKRQGWITFFY